MFGEFGEAANIVKKLNRCRDGIPGNTEPEALLRGRLADELADTYIYLDLFAQRCGVPLTVLHRLPIKPGAQPSEWVVECAAALGRVADSVDTRRQDQLAWQVQDTYRHLYALATVCGWDLHWAIAVKFAATSLKVGYTE